MSLYEKFYELAGQYISVDDESLEKFRGFFKRTEELKRIDDFTEMQKEALSNKDFWSTDKNVIVQGATSAGKTLVAEISMAYQVYCLHKKVVYLVPLKALASEKYRGMKSIFNDKAVYYSTSDYQNNDYNIVRNLYDISIMVYEKFYSLISSNNKFPDKTAGLMVIDELHMLNDKERGLKLEFSVEKLRCKNISSFSVLAMTTCECDSENVRNWLGNDKTSVILNDQRPVQIEERFIFLDPYNPDKNCYECYNQGKKLPDRNFELINVKEKKNPEYTLLQIIAAEQKDKQIIVFCNRKDTCEKLVKTICDSGVVPKINNTDEIAFPVLMDSDMEESHYKKLEKAVREYAVGYHNARLPALMREYIESSFATGHIRILVATETLTMGVNMPTDVMICCSDSVFRTDGERRMNYQEYKNIIGRCGRLGIKENGISYMIADDAKNFSNNVRSYAAESKKYVIASGASSDAETVAPYYLNLFSETVSEEELKEKIRHGLAPKNSNNDFAEKIIDLWKKGLCYGADKKQIYDQWLIEEGEEEDCNVYNIKDFGKAVRCFALSLDTFDKIYRYYFDNKSKVRFYKMPEYDTQASYTLLFDNPAIKHNYLLDVLITVCRQIKELSEKKQYLYPPDDTMQTIKECMKKFIQTELNGQIYWEGSVLGKFVGRDTEISNKDTCIAFYRAFILYYWVQGYDVTHIRKKLGLPNTEKYYIYTSEVKSFGEICAYILEAISAAFNKKGHRIEASMFYKVSICVKYGMDNELSKIANKHIRGISRQKLLKLKAEADNHKCSVTELLYYQNDDYWKKNFTDEQSRELQSIIRNNYEKNPNELLENMKADGTITECTFGDYSSAINDMSSKDWRTLLSSSFKLNAVADGKAISVDNGKLKIYIYGRELNPDSEQNCISIIRDTVSDQNENYILIFKGKNNYQPSDIVNSYCSRSISVDDLSRNVLFPAFERLGSPAEEHMNYHFVPIINAVIEALETKNFQSIDKRQKEIRNTVNQYILKTTKLISQQEDDIINTQNNFSVPSVQNINNYYIGTQNNTFIQNNYYHTVQNILNEYNNIVKVDKSSDDENKIADFLDNAEKTIKKEIPDADENSVKDFFINKNPSYDDVVCFMEDVLVNNLNYALYVHRVFLTQEDKIKDFSPASIMYGKFLEKYMRKYMITYLKEKHQNMELSINQNKKIKICDLTPDQIERITLGSFLVNCKTIPVLNNKLYSNIKIATDIRNDSCHDNCDHTITKDSIEKLRQSIFEIVTTLYGIINNT